MMFTVAGTKLYIGGQLTMGASPLVVADFAGQTWTVIGGLETMGTLGGSTDVSTWMEMSPERPDEPARTRKWKASANSGVMDIAAAADYEDAGQIAVIAASETSGTFAFKIELPDASARFFTALVVNAREEISEAASIYRFAFALDIDSNIVRETPT